MLAQQVAAWDEEQFRHAVTRNLAEGAVRLVRAVDEITPELKQTVTFLNRHTTSEVELLALELQRAVDHGVEVLVPKTYGEESATEKVVRRRLDKEAVLATVRAQHQNEAGERMIALYEYMRDMGARLSWGTSPASPR